MQQGDLIELEITDLNTSGEGVGRINGKVVFVPDTVTGDRINTRITHIKSRYGEGRLQQLLIPSKYRIRPRCIVADKCGGCQWQHIDWEYQRQIKRQQVIQALQRIGGFENIQVAPTLHSPHPLNYRNKSTYPLGIGSTGNIQAGYYRRGSHKIVNLNQCPVQDSRLHPLLREIKQDIQQQGWSIYDEKTNKGQLRHLSLRIGIRTGEILLTLVTTDPELPQIKQQAQIWLAKYPSLVGVCLNINQKPSNVIFGKETLVVAGKPFLTEIFAGVTLQILSDTFFQINTETAELLLDSILQELQLQGTETLVDAYCGIGTFTLPLARKVKQAIGIESYYSSLAQAKNNAQINKIDNVTFYEAKVEDYLQLMGDLKPDIIFLDPPRKGCNVRVLKTLLQLQPNKIVYVSCKPATLARDIKSLCETEVYQPQWVQPADFFPQTSHVECAVILRKKG
ncbi:MAG: 23S rRNA (uracil(1939)-C(5))-methyltransferase RlmD [Xenococcaceae cyanobacterium MO_167.B27]|nr:23S rRNA (uracil(1939)-C(5))-methyltransferase RlmD [Xenococcaceae cyanobacterium MO_167.B27]